MHSEDCKGCGSTGNCPTCNGSRTIESPQNGAAPLPCATCFGSGRCPTCGGKAKSQVGDLPRKPR